MHLGELGTQHVSAVTLMVPGQLIGSIRTSAKCTRAFGKLTLHSFENPGIPGKALKPQPDSGQASGKAGRRYSACCVGRFFTLKQIGSQLPIREDPGGSLCNLTSWLQPYSSPPPSPVLDLRGWEE